MMMFCNAFAAIGISQANEVKIGRMMAAHEARNHTPAMPSMFGGFEDVTLRRQNVILEAISKGPISRAELFDTIPENENSISAALQSLKVRGKIVCVIVDGKKKWQLS